MHFAAALHAYLITMLYHLGDEACKKFKLLWDTSVKETKKNPN